MPPRLTRDTEVWPDLQSGPIEHVPPDMLLANPANYRIHPKVQQDAMESILRRKGWADSILVNRRTGHVLNGHLRVQVALRNQQPTVPVRYIEVSLEEELGLLATFDPVGALAGLDADQWAAIRETVKGDDAAIEALLIRMDKEAGTYTVLSHAANAQPSPRKTGIDVIFCMSVADAACCMAVHAGWRYGFQSKKGFHPCPHHALRRGHEVAFIDNDFKDYDHSLHVDQVAHYQPKYCTVRDMMTPAQCLEMGMTYYEPDAILHWAEELARFAKNVIIIPKSAEYIDLIPPEYILGYSVPSSYGGTPLPLDLFRGRRVHLLGGSWKEQLHFLAALGEDVVSLDNNYIAKIADVGSYVTGDGECHSITDLQPLTRLSNPRYVALTLSLAGVSARMKELLALQISLGSIAAAVAYLNPENPGIGGEDGTNHTGQN